MFRLCKKIISKSAMYLVLADCLSFGSIASAFGEPSPADVQIKKFSSSDVVGAADITPEGKSLWPKL
ncbi:hypothetical protein [Paenibacillus sp. FSL H8-0034]|uniref:hypothetical protein n=1 Tax=Paenibacillus sp. FSL H8-0034 TaxID=2954671 RepID=UPI0030F74B91